MTKTIICKDVFGNQYTVPVDELNIRVGVYAVVIEDNKILLTRQCAGNHSEAVIMINISLQYSSLFRLAVNGIHLFNWN